MLHGDDVGRGKIVTLHVFGKPFDCGNSVDGGPRIGRSRSEVADSVVRVRTLVVWRERAIEALRLDFDELMVARLVLLDAEEAGGKLKAVNAVSDSDRGNE